LSRNILTPSVALGQFAATLRLAGDGRHTYFSQDGCTAHTLDFDTGIRRPPRKEDIEKMTLISDYSAATGG
jgi:hypothetical protein